MKDPNEKKNKIYLFTRGELEHMVRSYSLSIYLAIGALVLSLIAVLR